ncbi:MAG: hypothetical protein JW757_10125 [Anaerolineales bacterium]|nr:hypothetical protein [Anaerolineales bacterium]
MDILKTVTIGFLILESINVLTLYTSPGSKYANAVGVFSAWEKSKAHPEMHDFVKYLVNWVAGTKLIFISLLVVILAVADEHILLFVAVALIFSIHSFFWRMFPLVRKMDQEGQVEPRNYSQLLGWMIRAFVLVFVAAVLATLIG